MSVKLTQLHGTYSCQTTRENRVYTWTVVAETSVFYRTAQQLAWQPGVPVLGMINLHDPTTQCTKADYKRIEPLVWHIDVEFSRPPREDQQDQGGEEPPEDRDLDDDGYIAEIEWGARTLEVHELKDLDGKPYVNAAGDPFDPTPPKRITHRTLTIVKYARKFDPVKLDQWADAVNSDPFYGYPALTWLAEAPTASRIPEEKRGVRTGKFLWRVSYRFENNPDKWIPFKALNIGSQVYKKGPYGRRAVINGRNVKTLPKDGEGVKHNDSVLLDADGCQLEAGEEPVYLDFRQYHVRSFRGLKLKGV
ncbi:MAG: hypothetical protein ACOY3P_03605 [Planctomycetota bacterium]